MDIFSREYHLLEASKGYLFDKTLETLDAFEKANNPDPITFSDILRTMDNDKVTGYKARMYRDTVQNRLRMVLNTIGETIDCVHGFSMEKLS
ncbi:hypothetical protein MUP95_07340, partial [bacterium]|nr:hypothetical protein [bacterium]